MPIDLTTIAAVNETAPGTRQTPSLTTDAFLAFQYNPKPLDGGEIRRQIDVPFAGARAALKTGTFSRHPFQVELSGAGTTTGVTFWAKLLRACLFGAASVGGSSVTYPLISTGDGGALSLDGWKDGELHSAFGVRGNAVFTFNEKELPRINFDLQGLIVNNVPVVASTPGAPTLPSYPQPVEVNLANTIITLDSYTLGVRSLTIDLGMKTQLFSTTGQKSIIFGKDDTGDRRGISGTLVAELPGAATKNYFPAIVGGTPLAFSLVHGTTAGNIINITSPGFVPGDATYSVDANRLLMTIPFTMVPTAANNELVLITR